MRAKVSDRVLGARDLFALKSGSSHGYGSAVPFPDESFSHGVVVADYRSAWPGEFEQLSARIAGALGAAALAIDHVGSTSVPGLPAKDRIDVQVRVDRVDQDRIVPLMSALGFRCRPEPWNRTEVTAGLECAKLVQGAACAERARPARLRPDQGAGDGGADVRRGAVGRGDRLAVPAGALNVLLVTHRRGVHGLWTGRGGAETAPSGSLGADPRRVRS
jgi:hypothetical protein